MFYIYEITNKINGKTYIGQHSFREIDDGYMGSGILLQAAFKKYGIENFFKSIIASDLETQEEANQAEKLCIIVARHFGKAEYNIADGGQGGALRGFTGHHHTEESKKKTSEATSGSKNGMYGRHHSKETRELMSEKATGRVATFKGRKHTEESKEKNRLAHLGKHFSKETREKMSKTRKGQHWFNNGVISTRAYECPQGFQVGRIKIGGTQN